MLTSDTGDLKGNQQADNVKEGLGNLGGGLGGGVGGGLDGLKKGF